MELKEFGLYIAELRENSGFKSQRQLADKSGVSNGTIARIEGGTQKASPTTLKKLALHLKGVDYSDLMESAGYLDENKTLEKSNNESKINEYNPLDEINKMVKEYGIEQMGFFDIEKWKKLGPDEIDEIRRHFEWVVQKAQALEEEENNKKN
jgi:transcriptional regulator with XRE-family HTH domain